MDKWLEITGTKTIELKQNCIIHDFYGTLLVKEPITIFSYNKNNANIEVYSDLIHKHLGNQESSFFIKTATTKSNQPNQSNQLNQKNNKINTKTILFDAVTINNLKVIGTGTNNINMRLSTLNLNGNITLIPNLLIDSNKIKAKHSALIAPFNKEILFYLKTRGINETDAKKIIILEKLNIPQLNPFIEKLIEKYIF